MGKPWKNVLHEGRQGGTKRTSSVRKHTTTPQEETPLLLVCSGQGSCKHDRFQQNARLPP